MLTKVNIIPSFKMILTAGEFVYIREDGVIVVPLATFKNWSLQFLSIRNLNRNTVYFQVSLYTV